MIDQILNHLRNVKLSREKAANAEAEAAQEQRIADALTAALSPEERADLAARLDPAAAKA